MLKGIDVTLYVEAKSGNDPFGHPTYSYTTEVVSNVLVAPLLNDDITTTTDLVGEQTKYTLAIPKGDTHNWENTYVEFFGKKFKTYGSVVEGIEAMVPTAWHKKVTCELYE